MKCYAQLSLTLRVQNFETCFGSFQSCKRTSGQLVGVRCLIYTIEE